MFGLFTKKEPLTILKENIIDKARFKARIAFIDDEEIAHVERLRNDGYNIAHFDDILNIDDFIRKEYQVVILDIQGVGKNLTPNQEGWGILKYLKDEHPHTVVIMFTGADWSITQYNSLANRADDFIGKDLEFLDFKSKLDNGIRKAFSIDYHFEIEKARLTTRLNKAGSMQEIRRIIETYGANESKAMKMIKKHISDPETLKSISSLLSILNNLKKIFTGV